MTSAKDMPAPLGSDAGPRPAQAFDPSAVTSRCGVRGRRSAATQPTTANAPTTVRAVRNGGLPRADAATSTEPAIATPSEEPRFDTLRDTPEMSPWTVSGQADCTTLTEAVSMAPTPNPMRNRPGQKVQTAES